MSSMSKKFLADFDWLGIDFESDPDRNSKTATRALSRESYQRIVGIALLPRDAMRVGSDDLE